MSGAGMIRPDRLTETFLDLVRIDSESFHEREVAGWISEKLREMGAEVWFDDAGAAIGGDCGNLFARFAPTADTLPPILLSAHMDTVTPGRGIRPRMHSDRITSDGTTILGADDKSGCAIIFEALRVVLENRIPHGVIEVCFSVAEEQGLRGAKEIDIARFQSKRGVVFDSGDARCIFNTGPAADRMEWIVHGLAAHGGVHPENGISAVRIAAAAITSMPHGRIDAETTCNIGVVEAAGATNIVPPRVRVLGEARSRDPEKLVRLSASMSKCFHDAVANTPTVEVNGTTHRAKLEETVRRDYEALDVAPGAETIALVQRAADRLDRKLYLASMGGGCDANVFNRRGIECINLGTGMRDPHTLSEWLDLRDFRAAAELLVRIVAGYIGRTSAFGIWWGVRASALTIGVRRGDGRFRRRDDATAEAVAPHVRDAKGSCAAAERRDNRSPEAPHIPRFPLITSSAGGIRHDHRHQDEIRSPNRSRSPRHEAPMPRLAAGSGDADADEQSRPGGRGKAG